MDVDGSLSVQYAVAGHVCTHSPLLLHLQIDAAGTQIYRLVIYLTGGYIIRFSHFINLQYTSYPPVTSYGKPLATWLLVQTFSQVVSMSTL